MAQVEDNLTVEYQLPALRLVNNLPDTIDALSRIELGIIESLATRTDEELFEARTNSRYVERFGWRIQCACDYVIYNRATRAKVGRGNKADTETGKNAALRKQAKKIGVTGHTIRKNAQVYALIKEAEQNGNTTQINLDSLDEKGYYLAALTANDPIGVLSLLATNKSTLKRFRVSDAFRFISKEGLGKKAAQGKAIAAVRTASKTARFAYLKKLLTVLKQCPDVDLQTRLGLQDCLDDVADEIEQMYDDDVTTSINKNWSPECQSAAALAQVTNFPEADILRLIRDNDDFLRIPNTIPQRWHKVGALLPPELTGHNR